MINKKRFIDGLSLLGLLLAVAGSSRQVTEYLTGFSDSYGPLVSYVLYFICISGLLIFAVIELWAGIKGS